MTDHPHATWAVVLAAGEGTRLRTLTTDASGRATPKQYCSLFGGSTLLQDALQRGRALVGRDRLCAVVAAHHAAWWRGALWSLARGNVISQPMNRGTANGVLLAVLSVLARDPFARLVFLPADHFVENEDRLASAMRGAIAELDHAAEELVLVGIGAEEADPELGYIVPGSLAGRLRRVERFIEKPSSSMAAGLIADGALWNSFIFAARGTTLLALLRERMPESVDAMETVLARGAGNGATLEDLYRHLPEADFSRDVVEDAVERLRVVAAPACGWTDLGTARRVGETVRRVGAHAARGISRGQVVSPPPVTLADALSRPQLAL
jgi:mannose-1-phosphate guanylyltransferase